MKTTLIALLALVLTRASLRAKETTTTPARPVVIDADTTAIVRKYDAAEAKAKADYDRTVAAAKRETFFKVTDHMDALTLAGKLDAAVGLKEFIAYLTPASTTASTPVAVMLVPLDKRLGTWNETIGAKSKFPRERKFLFDNGSPDTWTMNAMPLTLIWMSKTGRNVG